jgi:outer membrane protein OmpA-like peptidoglycan-associated protein
MRMRKLRVVFSWAAISLFAMVSLAAAEPYLGLYGGAAFAHENDVRYSEFRLLGTNLLADVTVNNEGFETTGVLGGKFGYFLEPLPFLGFELDVFNIFGPDIDANRTRSFDVRVPNVGSLGNVTAPVSSVIDTGGDIELRVTSVMLNVIGRLPLLRSADFPQGRLNPYLGAGGGWVNAEIDLKNRLGGDDGDVTDTIGAQGIVGLKYFVSPNFALFTEYKYLHVFNAKWSFSGSKVQSDLDISNAVAGVAFHFPRRVAAPPPPPPPPPPAPPAERRVERVVLQSVHFEFDRSSLTPLGRRVLDEAAQKLQDDPRLTAEIEGHTDSIGTELYNLGLAQRRAEVVKGYLVLRHQVEASRMTTASYGESRPIADNRTAEGRALNRRVEFKVLVR